MKCQGLNEIYCKWYCITAKQIIICEHCKNIHDIASKQNFDYAYVNICEGYKMLPNSTLNCTGFDVSLWDKSLCKPYIFQDNNIAISNYNSNIYITNNLSKQYFSVIIKLDDVCVYNDIEKFIMYKSDFIADLRNDNNDNAQTTVILEVEIYVYDVIPENNICISNVNLGDYSYDKKTNMIKLLKANSMVKPKIKYSVHPKNNTYWNAESAFKLNSKMSHKINVNYLL